MDFLMAIALGIIQLALAVLGIHVSIKPLPQSQHKHFIVAFSLVGLLGIAVIVAQHFHSNRVQQELRDQLSRIEGTSAKIASDITSQANKPTGKPPTIINRITVNSSRPDRRIPATSHASMVKILAKKPGTVYVGAPANDQEAYQLALDIWGLLKKAGWRLPGGKIAEIISRLDPGITLEIHDVEGAEIGSLEVFHTAMNPMGLDIRTAIDNELVKGSIRINVGPRPPN
jgi:hypothetical protein